MSNSAQLCCNTFLSPFSNIPGSSPTMCCNILTPPAIVASGGSSGPTVCANVDCSAYVPVCFTTLGSNLCYYLAGIDAKLCALGISLLSIPCSVITMNDNMGINPYPCIPGYIPGSGLCAWALAVNNEFCAIEKQLSAITQASGSGSGTVSTSTTSSNIIVDGNNGVLNGTSGMNSMNGVLSLSTTSVHGNSNGSATITSTATPSQTVSLNTTTPIAVVKGQVYELKGYVLSGGGTSPSGAVVSMAVNGTGQSMVVSTSVTGTGNPTWSQYTLRYIPDVSQNVTVSVNITGFTSGKVLNFADIAMYPVSTTNSGAWYEYEFPQIREFQNVYNSIASNFVVSSNNSTSGLFITVGKDVYVINGKYIIGTQTILGLAANTTSYIFFDTWVDSYVVKTNNTPDATQMLLYSVTTNGSVITNVTNLFNSAPFSGSNIQSGSITGTNIASATVADSNLTATGVSATTYGDATHVGQFTVNAQGRITSASAVAITFPVTSVNSATGAVSLGIANMNDATITSPSNGQYLKYNGTKWVNASIAASYYQTVFSQISTTMTQRPGLNFSGYFTLTDDGINNVTTVTITGNSLPYSVLQQSVGGRVLLGNSTGGAANYSEQSVSTDLLLSGGTLSVNYVFNAQTVATYGATLADINGGTTIGMSNSGARTVNLPNATSVPVGRIVRIKDTNGNAAANNITIQDVSGTIKIDNSGTYVINTNYGHVALVSDGTQWWVI